MSEETPLVVIFRSRLRPENEEAYRAEGERMEALARSQPGFRSIKTFVAEDGERVTLSEFESDAAVAAWREHPEHRDAQRRGRELYYSEYDLAVYRLLRRRRFESPAEIASAAGSHTGSLS